MSEIDIMRAAQVAASVEGSRLWRNNVGVAYQGMPFKTTEKSREVFIHPGDILLRKARMIRFGLCEGSSDLIGITPKLITQDMVGKTIAVFTAAEAKKPGGKLTPEQELYLMAVTDNGGLAMQFTDPKTVAETIKKFRG